jgi:hypothetical protein
MSAVEVNDFCGACHRKVSGAEEFTDWGSLEHAAPTAVSGTEPLFSEEWWQAVVPYVPRAALADIAIGGWLFGQVPVVSPNAAA